MKNIIILLSLLLSISACSQDYSFQKTIKQWLKDNLKDPDSLQIIEYENLSKEGDDLHFFTYKYRSKNSYGGYSIDERIFILDAERNIINAASFYDDDVLRDKVTLLRKIRNISKEK